MGELTDKFGGKAKEIRGAATGDGRLEAEGKAERAMGTLKGKWEEAKHAIKEALHREKPPTGRSL
jgi:uncharacterized protein YjbJ (UPF0337 family)